MNKRKTSGQGQDHRTDAAVATIWLLVLTLVVVFEIASLFVSRSMFATVHL